MIKFFWAITWGLTVVISYWLGQIIATKSSSATDLSSHSYEINSPNADLQYLKFSNSTINPVQLFNENAVFTQPEEVHAVLTLSEISHENLDSNDPIKRLLAFASLLEEPDSPKIQTALQTYESLPGGPGRFSELKMLAFAWGQVNPQGALAWAQKQQHWDEHIASSSIMDSWARNDADAAISWAKENFDGEENPYFVGIINGLSETSLAQATDLMTDLPYGRVRGRAAHILFEKVWSKGEDMAIHWAENLPQGSLQDFAYGELGEKVARSDMNRAVEWVESMEESSIKVAVSEDVSREMVKQDPSGAGTWVMQMPDGASKEAAITQIAKIWSKKDPVATADWINQFPEETNVDSAIEILVKQISGTDPEGALSWASTISNPDRRQKLVQETQKKIQAQDGAKGGASP
jgi:hypothetical protein